MNQSSMPPVAAGAVAVVTWLVVVAAVPLQPAWLGAVVLWTGLGAATFLLLGAARPRLASVAGRFVPPAPQRRAAAVAAPATAATLPGVALPQAAVVATGYAPALAAAVPAPASAYVPAVPPTAAAMPQVTSAPLTSMAAAAVDLVRLGQTADPAFPSWQLHWQTPDGRQGVVVLPSGKDVVFGRLEPAAVLADLTEVSRKHLRFVVSGQQVAVAELGSSNGTWLRQGSGMWIRLPTGEPMPLQARDQLRIADPWAMVLTLEPVVR